jgi:hypothetical protein
MNKMRISKCINCQKESKILQLKNTNTELKKKTTSGRETKMLMADRFWNYELL